MKNLKNIRNRTLPRMYSTPPDESERKAYPNGILVTFAAIWQAWASADRDDVDGMTSSTEFARYYDLLGISEELKRKYPFSPPYPGEETKKDAVVKAVNDFQRIGGSTMNSGAKSSSLSYMALRRAAETVRLPLGLFILFTNFVSLERRAEKMVAAGQKASKREVLLELAEKIEKYGREARRVIEEASDDDEIFYQSFKPGEWDHPKNAKSRPGEKEETYLARMPVLRRLRDACKIGKSSTLM